MELKQDFDTNLLKRELEASLANNRSLKKENEELRRQVESLKTQITTLKAYNNERKSMLWKKLQSNHLDPSLQKLHPRQGLIDSESSKEKPLKGYDEPLSLPTLASQTSSPKEVKDYKIVSASKLVVLPPPPPPPPPLPSKALGGLKAVRRVPEVIQLYRSLTRRDAHMEKKTNPAKNQAMAFTKNMIGEIENRSRYISAVKTEVETQAEFINFLMKEVESAAYKKISDVEAFVSWLDEQLSTLVDERAVLKHFPQWPERKADTLREAAFNYRDLKNLNSEVLSFQDNLKEPLSQALRRVQELQDRLEQSINSIERIRESTSKRYRDFQIPWDWMMETGMIGQMKLSSMRLAKAYMKRITKEMQSSECTREDSLMLQGVRFAYRVHQFAGGFDGETIHAFEELKQVVLCESRYKQLIQPKCE